MTITSIRTTAIVTAALASVAMSAAPATAAGSEPATHAPGARLDIVGPTQLLMSSVTDEHARMTPAGLHVGGDGYSGGTLLIR